MIEFDVNAEVWVIACFADQAIHHGKYRIGAGVKVHASMKSIFSGNGMDTVTIGRIQAKIFKWQADQAAGYPSFHLPTN